MYEAFELTNYTLMGINNQSHITNLTVFVTSNSNHFWYESTLISTLLGVIVGSILTFMLTIFQSRLQEKAELKRYEYNLLSIIMDLLSNPLDEVSIKNFIDEIYTDLKFSKLKIGCTILSALVKAKNGESYLSEMQKIEKRFEEIYLST